MKKSIFTLMVLVLTCSVTMAQPAGKSKMIKPSNYQNRIITIVSGKTRYYYSLSTEKASIISLHGPGKLRVISRCGIKTESIDKFSYGIIYNINGEGQKTFSVNDAHRSKTDIFQDGMQGFPGESKEFTIELDRGDHSIEFRLRDNNVPVAARYIFTPLKEKKTEWIAYSPVRPSEPIDLVSGETTVTYYRFSKDKPLKIEVIGPTELKVMTRIENHYQMRGRIQYRIQVKEDNLVKNTYFLNSERSESAVYKENKELIPGKACEFIINVPEGMHNYSIVLLGEDKSTVLGRLLLPKKDVKLDK